MGNIYSEVGRSFKAQNEPNSRDRMEAITRAIDLFDATIYALTEAKSPKLKEVLRSKEEFLNTITDVNASQKRIQSLDSYFLQFAIAARLRHSAC